MASELAENLQFDVERFTENVTGAAARAVFADHL